jgi:hypothetical protein
MSWPGSGPWVVSASSVADALMVAAALAHAAPGTVAAAVIGPGQALLRDAVDGYAEFPAAGSAKRHPDEVLEPVRALAETHDLVLVVGADLFAPLGRRQWTLADLAAALPAPIIVATRTDDAAVRRSRRVLKALLRRSATATAIVVGAGPDPDLPVTPAGRIPADVPADPESFAADAPGWLDPLLHGTRTQPPTSEPAPPSEPAPRSPDSVRTVAGTRFVPAFFASLAAVLALVGLASWWLWPDPPRNQPLADATGHAYLEPGLRYRVPPPGSTVVTAHASAAGHVPPPVAVPRPRRSAAEICPRDLPGVTPTDPDAATVARVDAAWDRIERWLGARAPATAAALRPGAPADTVAAAQRRMSVRFPPDLVASLRRHDGGGRGADALLPPFHRLFTVGEVVNEWWMYCEVTASTGNDGDYWNRRYVPFAGRDDMLLIVDQRAPGHGRVGRFYSEDGASFADWPGSLVELLEQVAAALETGQPVIGRYRPAVRFDGTLDWTD